MGGSIFTGKETETQEKLSNLPKIEQLESGEFDFASRRSLVPKLCAI